MSNLTYPSDDQRELSQSSAADLRADLIAAELPPPSTKRWVMRRKAAVVGAVRNGLLSVDEACQRYKLSLEEFISWQRLIEDHGLPGLRATRIQLYRSKTQPE